MSPIKLKLNYQGYWWYIHQIYSMSYHCHQFHLLAKYFILIYGNIVAFHFGAFTKFSSNVLNLGYLQSLYQCINT